MRRIQILTRRSLEVNSSYMGKPHRKKPEKQPPFESPRTQPQPQPQLVPTEPVRPPHRLRRIIFLLGALIMLALLILLLIRGPVRRDSLPRETNPLEALIISSHAIRAHVAPAPRR
jgi:hypothetical protein